MLTVNTEPGLSTPKCVAKGVGIDDEHATKATVKRRAKRFTLAIFAAVARVRLLVAAPHVFERHIGIDLRGRETLVPEQLFDRHEVGSVLEQMRGKRMAHHV